ncbi:MAG: ABC transporter permease [Bacteroidales bacterium]|jgi:ABC-type antimicrobial peptide transport system permease subunit|nr:ABC transporter permease [Bacteroidales bacterium]
MIQHYLKIAFRNLWKYKKQTLISIVGLASGFACFALATLWIRYEMTYDNFHKNADRIYCVGLPNMFEPGRYSRTTPYPLAEYLKAAFPEIANAVPVDRNSAKEVFFNKVEYPAETLKIDSSFFRIFNVKIIEGSMDFLVPGSNKIAITEEKARRIFGNGNPLGQMLSDGKTVKTVCAIVTGLPKRSNFPFDLLESLDQNPEWGTYANETLVELHPGIDVEAFRQKLYEHTVSKGNITKLGQFTLIPITEVHYKDPKVERDVKFQHIVIFSFAGLLLIVCTLFNHLTLFAGSFRMRRREFALRIICGASNRSLFMLLSAEFLMSLSAAFLTGLFLMRALLPSFIEISRIRLGFAPIYLELSVYIAGIILISLLAFLAALAIFRRRSLDASIRGSNRKAFRKVSVVVQLIVSIGFTFCTTVILKQMYHLHHTDLGFSFKNRGCVVSYDVDADIVRDKLRQIPEITETVTGHPPLTPRRYMMAMSVDTWDDKPENLEYVNISQMNMSEQYFKHYELEMVEGEMLNDSDDKRGDVVINESAAKAFGWKSAVGKSFGSGFRVKGVMKNAYNAAPTVSVPPHFYHHAEAFRWARKPETPWTLFKFREGTWETCRDKIEEIFRKEYPQSQRDIRNTEDEYNVYLKSENTLLKILTLVSLICVIVCVFGFVSIVSLTCEERRMEIAVRKINGATVKDILDIFFKEYLALLAVGALIAFPAGYVIMKRWLDSYVVRTEISAWIYVSILLALMMVIVLCVGGKVYTTSRENPVKAIKM